MNRLLTKAESLLTQIRAYSEKIATESEAAPPCYRTEDTAQLKKAKHTGVGGHLAPAIDALVTAINACNRVIDADGSTLKRIHAIEQHLGAIASNSAYTQGVTSRFRAHYQALRALVQQFKISTSNPTGATPLIKPRDAAIPNPLSAGVTVRPESFDESRRLSQPVIQKIADWTRECYEPLQAQLAQFLERTSPDDPRHHGVNNHLSEALRLTKIALDFYSIGGDTGTLSADENIKKAEEMLGAVASWSPYFRIPCGAVSSEFKGYYQSTCKLVEAAKAILPDHDYTRSRRFERPSIVPVASASNRNILTVIKRGSITASSRSLLSMMMMQPYPLLTELPPTNTRDSRRAERVRTASTPPGSRSSSVFLSTSKSDRGTTRVSSPLSFSGTF